MQCHGQVPGDASGGHVTITCHFNQTGSTEVQVTPAAAAQQSSTNSQTAESPIDDLTDDFAAGDAAVQVPVCHFSVHSTLSITLQHEFDRICIVGPCICEQTSALPCNNSLTGYAFGNLVSLHSMRIID